MDQFVLAFTVAVVAAVQTVFLTWIGWKVLFKLGPRGQMIMLTVVTVVVLNMLIYAVQHGAWILFACVAGWIACVRLAWHRRHTEAVTECRESP